MRKQISLLVILSLAIVATSGCRSRRRVPPPQAVPPAVTTPQSAVAVPSADRDFAPTPADPSDVIPREIEEANRVARQRGWIRDAFFTFDSSLLSAEAQSALRQSATWLRQNPDYRIRIEGHCDERGTEQYNLALGDRRAATAATYLETLGVDPGRIRTVSYGEERPFEEGSYEAAWAQNRRAHLVLTDRR